MTTLQIFRKYTRRCRPVWTLTWRDCVSPSIHSGVPVVREEDTEFNKGIAVKYIEELDSELQASVQVVLKYLAKKPENLLTYTAKTSSGYRHRIYTSEWQAMNYFIAILNIVIREVSK